MRRALLPLPLLLAACGGPPVTPQPVSTATPAPATAAVESAPEAEPSYTLDVPERWTRKAESGWETISGPDGQVTLKVLETSGDDLGDVIAASWKAASPEMALTERNRSTGARNERFSEQLVISYTDDANEHLAQGVALRHIKDPKKVYVLLVEGPLKVVQKRSAELKRVLTSIEVKGAAKLALDPKKVQPFDEARRTAFFTFVDAARELVGVPGTAIGIVSPQGVFTRGFGERALGGGRPVDADTQFMIGSVTKSFSTLLLATLVDEGKVGWNDKVTTAYPAFAMADERGQDIEIRHLFCACVGAPRQDMEMIFDFAGKRAGDVFAEVKSMKLTTDFGETFQYNNQLTAAGGFIAGHVAMGGGEPGRAYEAALKKRVLDPIGMTSSMLRPERVRARGNHAMPHHLDWTGKTEPVDLKLERFVVPYAPAGALWSTANDMTKYLQLQLSRGANAEGERVVSEASLGKTQSPQVKVSAEAGYGMGWIAGKYRGLVAVEHSGGTMGFNSDLVFFPEIGVGMFVVGNRSPAAMHGAVRARLMEVLFDLPEEAESNLAHNLEEMKKAIGKAAEMVDDDAVPKSVFGRYRSERLGSLTVRPKGARAIFDVGEWQAEMAPVDPEDRKGAYVLTSGVLQGMLLLDQEHEGKPALVLKHSQTDYVFVKAP